MIRLMMVVAAVAAATGAFGEVPMIRHVASAPFKEGKAEAKAWATADVCTRFIEVVKNNVARHQTEARLLFDDQNLYVSLKGFFDEKYDRGDKKNGMGSVNNFEVFLKPSATDYLQIIVDEFGRLYVGKGKSEMRDSGVKAAVEKGKGFWTADLTIPFAALGFAAPTEDTAVKVGLFRWNINVHEREKLWSNRGVASGFTPNAYNYGIPDLWADMTFTRKAGEAKRVEGPTFGARVNLFPNPDFDAPCEWAACGKTVYTETMAMSGEWIFRGFGKDYQIVQLGAGMLKPKTRYTLVVKARCFGSGSGLRIVQIARGKDGKTHEGTYVTMLTPLGPDMHEYFLPFTTDADPSWTMVFYKVDNRADDTGIELAAVRCYEGEISSFEVRKLSRPGRMAVIKGTEVPVAPNPVGRFAKKPNVLAFVNSKYALREPEEIFAGTGADLDVLLLSGKGADVYSTYGDTKKVTERAAKGEYDLVMVPVRGAEMIGKEMAKHIRTCVEKGGGLYIEKQPKGYGLLDPLVKDAKGGVLGKGRVVLVKTAGGSYQYLPAENDRANTVTLFPADAPRLRVAAAAWRAAVGAVAEATPARTEEQTFVYAGKNYVFTKKLDASGATLDWTETATPVDGPRLGTFTDDGKTSTVVVTGDVAGVTLAWQFRDFSGRILAKDEVKIAGQGQEWNCVSLVLPREKLYTNFGGIRLALVKDGKEIDVRGEGIFVRDNDKKRLMDDYTPSMWPGSGERGEMDQLEDIGIRASVLACAGGWRPAWTIASGFGVGSSWLGDGSTFCGWAQKSNVRAQNFNTKRWREEKPMAVQRAVKGVREYGFLDYALCDEPNFSRTGAADELDAHPENLAEYRVRMEKKYGTIAEYNRRHETAYGSFAELNQTLQADARKAKKYAEFIEWRNFNVDRWCEAIKLVSDNARAVDDAPFTMCNSFGQSALSGNDYWKLLTRAGLGFSTEYTAMVYFGRQPIFNFDEFIRSFRPDMRCWGWTGYFYSRDRARFMPWWTACHRYGGFSWYAATNPGYNIVDSTTYARTVDGEDLRQSLLDTRMLDGFGKVLTCWEWDKRDIAIYYSHDSMLLSTILGTETKNGEIATVGPLHDHMHSRQGAYYTVEGLLYQHDFVAPEQVTGEAREKVEKRGGGGQRNDFLSSFKALFMPRVIAMSDAEVAAVKAYLAKGGKMMCDALPGDYDELGVKRAANPFAGLAGVTVYGKNFDDLNADCRTAVKAFLESAGATKAVACEEAVSLQGREAMHYVSGDADLYAVIRMYGKDTESQTLRFAKKGHVYDVVARKYLGETDSVKAQVPANEGVAYAVLPAKIDNVSIAAPATVARGADLAADFVIEEAKAKGEGEQRTTNFSVHLSSSPSPSYILHAEVVPPSGKARFHFKRNLMTENGRAHLDFPLAFNDEPGTWKLRVTEPLTGVTAEKTFVLK